MYLVPQSLSAHTSLPLCMILFPLVIPLNVLVSPLTDTFKVLRVISKSLVLLVQ